MGSMGHGARMVIPCHLHTCGERVQSNSRRLEPGLPLSRETKPPILFQNNRRTKTKAQGRKYLLSIGRFTWGCTLDRFATGLTFYVLFRRPCSPSHAPSAGLFHPLYHNTKCIIGPDLSRPFKYQGELGAPRLVWNHA